MKIYNSLSGKPEAFLAPDGGRVTLYVCGLTPYDSAHIGHARAFVAFDVLRRILQASGMRVLHIQNVTDVDDKIIRRCRETGADPRKLTSQVHDEALELFDRLHVLHPDAYPKVTEHMAEIIELVRILQGKGFAYETPTGVYFDVSRFPKYGALSRQRPDEIKAGSRKEVDETKDDPADFALWKKTKGEIIEFDSPWGKGRPGWHIECSAMSMKYCGETLDIHGGARDLIFPHHENEIAQSEAATGRPFARFWCHTGFLTVDGEKMSKSLGNFVTLKEALQKFSPNALRLFYMQAHYRSPLDYNEDAVAAAGETAERIFNSLGLAGEHIRAGGPSAADREFRKESDAHISGFFKAMEDDLDTPRALAELFGLLRVANAHMEKKKPDLEQLRRILEESGRMLWVLGLEVERAADISSRAEPLRELLSALELIPEADAGAMLGQAIAAREAARKAKDFRKADLIRARLAEMGITLEDKKEGGVRWKLA